MKSVNCSLIQIKKKNNPKRNQKSSKCDPCYQWWSTGTDFLVPKQPHEHTVMPRRSKPWEKIAGWSDCAWVTGGCLSFTLPARGLILPQQPCRFPCSRPLTGSRKQPGLSVSCPGSAALRLMTPTALCWQLRNKHAFLAVWEVFSLIRWSALEIAALSLLMALKLAFSFPPWTHPSMLLEPRSSPPPRHLASHWRSVLRGYRGDAIWLSHALSQHSSPWRLWEAALTNRPAPCLSAAHWDSTVPLWQIFTLHPANAQTPEFSELLIC